MDINAYVSKDGKLQPFTLNITKPERVSDEESLEFREFYSIVTIPTIFKKQKVIYGTDEDTTLENTYTFIKALLQDLVLLDEHGEPIDVPWSHVKLSKELDNKERHDIGVVACLVKTEDGALRLVFDDVKSKTKVAPQQWTTECLFTWVDLDFEKVVAHELTDKQYEEIGFNLVARLVASMKTQQRQ
jgi:hypothetical protein